MSWTFEKIVRENVTKDGLARRLEEARERTQWLLRAVSDEELWLLQRAFGRCLSDRELHDIYDASLTGTCSR